MVITTAAIVVISNAGTCQTAIIKYANPLSRSHFPSPKKKIHVVRTALYTHMHSDVKGNVQIRIYMNTFLFIVNLAPNGI